ncbi:MAG: hypothetical protein KDD44_04210, partial [Bdellovibrionales bacterium]|nr:hypothetical protein [Bdellovibrionales bacterium]
MSAILIVSADPSSVSRIEETLESSGRRVRSVSAAAAAQEWLSMTSFSAVLVDARFGERSIEKLAELTWNYNPLTLFAVFDFYNEVPYRWDAALLGVLVFCQPDTPETIIASIKKVIDNLPPEDTSPGSFPILVVEDLDSPRAILCSYIETLGYREVTGV